MCDCIEENDENLIVYVIRYTGRDVNLYSMKRKKKTIDNKVAMWL